MTTKDVYVLELIDKILAPLKAIEKQATSVNQTLERMEKLASGGVGFAKMAAGVGVAIGGLMALKGAVTGVMHVLEKAAEGAWEFGKKIVEATRFRVQNINALETFLGKGKGEPTFKDALRIGGISPASEIEVTKQMTGLAAAGFEKKGLYAANAALLDVGAMMGDQNRQELLYYFQKLHGTDKVEADDFRRIAQLAGIKNGVRGLRELTITAAGGKPGANDEETFKALAKAKKITGQTVLEAAMAGVNTRHDEGKGLGYAAQKMGMGTLEGLISNLEAAPMRFLAEMKLENLPGIKSLMDFLKRLLVFFDHATPQGQKLAAVVEKMVNSLFAGLDKLGPDALERFFNAGIEAAEKFRRLVGEAWSLIGSIASWDLGGLMRVLNIAASIASGIWQIGGALVDGLLAGIGPGLKVFLIGMDELLAKLGVAGGMMTVLKGLLNGLGVLVGAVAGLFMGMAGAVAYAVSKLSVLFDWLGKVYDKLAAFLSLAAKGGSDALSSIIPGLQAGWAGMMGSTGAIAAGAQGAVSSVVPGLQAGLAGVPHMASGGIVDRPTLALIGESGPEAVVPLGRGGGPSGGDVVINIGTVNLSGENDQERVMQFRDLLTEELRGVGYRMGA